jgi:D-alanyl-D-alanine carboxypeptidase
MRRRHLTASVLLVGLAAAGLTGCSPAGSEVAAPSATSTAGADAAELAPEVQAALDALVESGATAAVIDVRDGAEHSVGAAGALTHDASEPAEADDQLRIASVTKSMSATVVLQLTEEGLFDLDSTVDELLPGLLDAPSPVTVEQLLNHTSGLPDYLNVLAPDAAAYLATTDTEYTGEQLVEAAQTLPWVSPPGEQFAYANTNYAVLGLIAEATTGETMPELLQSRIFDPLDMHDSEYPEESALPEGALRGVLDIDGVPTDTGDASASLWNAGAAVTSTIGDVSTFFQGLFGGELVSAESLAAMQEIGVEGYGYGILAGGDACGVPPPELVFGQRGNGVGYRVMAFGSPDASRFVTVGWTGGTFDPATDDLVVPGNTALVTALQATCP